MAHQDNAGIFHRPDVSTRKPGLDVRSADRLEQAHDVAQLFGGDPKASFIGAVNRIPHRSKTAGVRFDRGDMVGEFVRVFLGVLSSAGQTVLFVGPQDDSNRPSWNHVQATQDVDRLHRHDATSAVVVRALTNVPGVDVPADHDDLIGIR